MHALLLHAGPASLLLVMAGGVRDALSQLEHGRELVDESGHAGGRTRAEIEAMAWDLVAVMLGTDPEQVVVAVEFGSKAA